MRKAKFKKFMEMGHMLTEDGQNAIIFGGRVSVRDPGDPDPVPRYVLMRSQRISFGRKKRD
jgi:hypothetical protein